MKTSVLFRLSLLVALLVLGPGCGSKTFPAEADPDQAREALRMALETWQKGERPEVLGELASPVTMGDEDWQAGHRLVRYRLTDRAERIGVGLRCGASLTLQRPKGRIVQKTVTYRVQTEPRLVIVREDL
jgi:hypothetical protein